jgi:hypothetical protein
MAGMWLRSPFPDQPRHADHSLESVKQMSLVARMKAKVPNRLVNYWEEHLRPHLPDLSFITLHYLYFIATGLTSAIIFWGSSTPAKSVSFTDSLFLCVSAMTEAGTC